jgi:hypothetical protein
MIARLTVLTFLAAYQLFAETKSTIIDGSAPGWKKLTSEDFMDVNCGDRTWTWNDNSVTCTGEPIGVIATKKQFKNFELLVEWKHIKPAGNSGIFVWALPEVIKNMQSGTDKSRLPQGIEVQVLDLEFKNQWETNSKKKATWFTCHGDVFALGNIKFEPFPPVSPDKTRSFPTLETTKPHGEWNHYYVRCINGEVRLWVNGKEVSGGKNVDPANGHICLESEGSPIEFKNFLIRELP